MRHVLIGLLALLPWTLAWGAELHVESGAKAVIWTTQTLLAHPQVRTIEIAQDVSYKRAMQYRALPLSSLLEGVQAGDQLQLLASDGFAAELPAALVLGSSGSRAWLAIEDPAQPWPPLAAGKPSAGPFYLVWENPEASQIGPEQWPFQLARIRTQAPLAERYPQLLPAADASDAVHAGFAQFQKHCLACHRLNGAGDSQFGPDLNVPHNPTEYFRLDFLARYIRAPQSLRRWPQGRMPGFTPQVLSEQELGALLSYLQHMAGRKVQL